MFTQKIGSKTLGVRGFHNLIPVLAIVAWTSSSLDAGATYNGQVISYSAPTSITLGQTFSVTITVGNSGTDMWRAYQSGVNIYPSYKVIFTNFSWNNGWGSGFTASDNQMYHVPAGASDTVTHTLRNDSFLPMSPTNPGTYSVTVVCKYHTSLSTDSYSTMAGSPTTFTFTVLSDVNHSPTNIIVSSTKVAENLPSGATVGTLHTQDPDAANTFTYSLVAGSGSDDNSSFTISGSNLQTTASFNYEMKSSYSIRVQSVDQGGMSTEKILVVTVTDVDEVPVLYAMGAPTNGLVVLRWSSVTNHQYTIEYSTNLLAGFSVLQSNIAATPVMNTFTDTVQGAAQKFWKITTQP